MLRKNAQLRNPTSLGLTGKPIAVISNVVVPLDLVASTVTAPAESDSTVTEFANNATETSLTEEEELLVEQLRAEREVQTTAERLADESYLLPNTFASDYSPPREEGLLDSRAGRRLVFGVPLALADFAALSEEESAFFNFEIEEKFDDYWWGTCVGSESPWADS